MQQLLLWTLFGSIAALIIHQLNPHGKGGLFAALFLGILGAIELGFALSFLNITTGSSLVINSVTAFIGGVSLLLIQRFMARGGDN